MTRRHCQRFVVRPAPTSPGNDGRVLDASSCGPVLGAHCQSGMRQEYVTSAVATLFRCSGPSAILWRVVAVVVASVQLMDWRRSRTHICQEGLKRIRPALAHRNAPAAISVIALIVCVVAPLPHSGPYSILRSYLADATGSMRGGSQRCDDLCSTAATIRRAASQVIGSDNLHFTALAQATPISVTALGMGEFYDGPLAESLTPQVYRHASNYLTQEALP